MAIAPLTLANAKAMAVVAIADDTPNPESETLAQVFPDLCDKKVVLLGEADHGDGMTVAFKVALVRQLIEKCHFDTVLFEGSHYDFLEISRLTSRGQPVDAQKISGAIGGLWNRDREFLELPVFLGAKLAAGKIRLGGLDDQPGNRDGFYSLDRMADELSGFLEKELATSCHAALRRHIRYEYSEENPYTPAKQAEVMSCLDRIASGLQKRDVKRSDREFYGQIVEALKRAIGRDFIEPSAAVVARDTSMFEQYKWISQRLPARAKIIVWGATIHLAKDASSTRSYPTGGNFGSYLHAMYEKRAFVLGFSALHGSHRESRSRPSAPISNAEPASLEGFAADMGAREAKYFNAKRLNELGRRPSGIFSHKPVNAAWGSVVDGVVIFREERPVTVSEQ